jgi:hypothetical protein
VLPHLHGEPDRRECHEDDHQQTPTEPRWRPRGQANHEQCPGEGSYAQRLVGRRVEVRWDPEQRLQVPKSETTEPEHQQAARHPEGTFP